MGEVGASNGMSADGSRYRGYFQKAQALRRVLVARAKGLRGYGLRCSTRCKECPPSLGRLGAPFDETPTLNTWEVAASNPLRPKIL